MDPETLNTSREDAVQTPEPEPTEPTTEEVEPSEEPAEEPEKTQAPGAPDLEPGDEEYSEKVQKRIGKAVAKQREAEREAQRKAEEAEYWRRQAMKESPAPKPPPGAATAEEQPPKEDDFDTYDEYVRAQARYEARQETRREWQAQQQMQQARERQARIDAKLRKGAAKYTDFADVVFRNPAQGGPQITPEMADECAKSEITEDLAYYLAKNPDIADDIAAMSNRDMIRAIARIETGIESGEIKLQAKTTTNAPPPIPHRIGGNESGTELDPDKLPIDEWMRRSKAKTLKYK